ncbi:MAG TPA: acetyl-CoA carboxylase biotin carboxyl carrier protein subunit [Euzebyales bacterium]|nr:acetyl-CoA carboxylase biotin carboxyl carrier protein subunit [Euzebyales bacterium]
MTRDITADIAASVVRVEVAVGDVVTADQALVVLESMKMEIPVLAAAAGRVAVVGVAVGDTVLEGDLLVTIESQRDDQGAV